ncbi:hypothetical protein [uncultured Alistipes sp.]|uniref:hypothetical protein n=1 Tax=uncultured Alistipes sp. TaxID=538949 RepID=UPI002638A264|nr:hypothetical protein [uncultured Alistipes sp.]
MTEYTKRVVFGWMSSLAVLLAGCAETQVEEPRPGPVSVRVAAAREITRTEIEENGTVTRWSPDDRIALWASDGSALALTAEPFALWHFGEEYPEAWFTAQIDPMAEGRYTYYGAYPEPDALSGTVAEYDLPAVQDGSKSMRRAVMVARPAEGEALTGAANGELRLSFVHKLHILKITIPEQKNLLGQPIHRLELDFGRPVAGRLTVDVSDPEAPAALTEGKSVLSLDFPTPVDAGATIFAVIAPVDLSDGEVSFRAYSQACESESISMPGKHFLAGHTTPIRLTIPAMRKATYIDFSLGTGELNHLGEEPRSFRIRLLDGGSFPGGETELDFAADASNRYEYAFVGEFADNLSGKRFEVVFTSDHAVVRSEYRMPDVQVYGRTVVPALEVPYLFFEDFSGLSASFENRSEFSNSDTVNASAISLGSYALEGWFGARIGGLAGGNIRIASRVEMGLWARNVMLGRVDSAPLANLTAPATIRVTYDYAGDYFEGVGSGGFPVYSAGCSRTAVKHGSDAIERVAENVNGIVLASDGNHDNSAMYGVTPHTESYTMEACDAETRLSWSVTNNRASSFAGNGQYWLYIDNVRVSIVPQDR